MICIKKIICVLFILMSSGFSAPNNPQFIAEKYFDLWTKGNVAEGLEKYWNINLYFETYYGRDYSELSESNKIYIQNIFTNFFSLANNLEKIKSQLKGATITINSVKNLPGHIKRQNGVLKTSTAKSLIFADFKFVKGQWKIVNVGNNGKGLEALALNWRNFKKSGNKNTMISWLEIMLSQLLSSKYPTTKK